MKNKFLTSFFVTFIFITFSSCNWLIPKCEGYYLYEITDYPKIDFHYLKDSINGIIQEINSDYYKIKYNELTISIIPALHELGITEECSYLEYKVVDSIVVFDIYTNTNYNTNFAQNSNLNKLFVTLFKGDSTVYQKLISSRLSSGPSLFLNQAPSQTDTFIFDIYIELNDGRAFDLQSRPIIITP